MLNASQATLILHRSVVPESHSPPRVWPLMAVARFRHHFDHDDDHHRCHRRDGSHIGTIGGVEDELISIVFDAVHCLLTSE